MKSYEKRKIRTTRKEKIRGRLLKVEKRKISKDVQ